jgi:adenosylmethionine-8-amino-7-oxononanoate aminotransferase
MFASEWASPKAGKKTGGITPDFMCLSKGLTGGTLPLAVTLTTDDIYAGFYADYAEGKAFLHSHSYTGNPLACAAALATLDIFAQQDWHAANREKSSLMFMAMNELARHPRVADIRQQGMILAVELAKNVRSREPYPPAERRGLRVYEHGLKHGVLLRPLGNVVYFMPPYVITPEEIVTMCRVAIEGIEVATAD